MKNNINSVLVKMRENFFSEKKVGGRRRLYNSLWALLFGLLASIIIISFTGNNPFEVFQVIFQDAVQQDVKFVTTTVVFIVATLGTAMCFKSGIFNIGISGQMMAGGMTSILILKLVGMNGGTIVLSIILAMISGALVAAIAGILKAFLKVNEVVSTILLNWIVFYVIKFIIQSDIPGLVTPESISQNQTAPIILPDFFYSSGWMAILAIFGIILIFFTWFIFSKTSIGYKMKMLALNKDAFKYSGSNERLILISLITITGALSGLAGFLYYTELRVIRATIEPISLGFDTIAIALLVYSNPFGIGISSILFTIIQLGVGSLKSSFPPLTEDFAQMMFGIIIYIAAIGVVFERFKIYTYLRNYYIYKRDPHYNEALNVYKINKKTILETQKNNNVIVREIKSSNKKIWKEIKKKSINQKDELDQELLISKKMKLMDLTEEQQQYYFSQINCIKKEKDNELFKNRYFEIIGIKNFTKSSKLENKNIIREKQKEILEKYELEKQKTKCLKGADDGNI